MECYFYAQLDDDNIVVGVSQLSGKVSASNMIKIDDYDISLLGKRYNSDTGEFEEVPQLEPTIESTIIEEQIYAETLYQTALLEMQMLEGGA